MTISGVVLVLPAAPLAPAAAGDPLNASGDVTGSKAWTSTLEGVSADSATDVWAVGLLHNDRQQSKTFIEHWDGSAWAVVPSPNRSPIGQDVLQSVSAISPTDAWAVGSYTTGPDHSDRTLVLHWDGHRWSHVPSPSGHNYSELSGVSAVSANNVWAVGALTREVGLSHFRALFEHWDGTSWSIANVVHPRQQHTPEDVSAVSRNDVWAGGGDAIFHRGTKWRVVDQASDVESVSMDSATDGWAVGDQIALHWDGSTWVSVSRPFGYLEAVTAISPTDAWAAGEDLEHWNGTKWSYVESPASTVLALDAVSSNDVWAVGGPYGPALIEHWDGNTWTVLQH